MNAPIEQTQYAEPTYEGKVKCQFSETCEGEKHCGADKPHKFNAVCCVDFMCEKLGEHTSCIPLSNAEPGYKDSPGIAIPKEKTKGKTPAGMKPIEQFKNAPKDLTPEYLDYLCKAGCDTNSFLQAEAQLTTDATFRESYISIAEAIRVFYALIWLDGKDTTQRLKSFQTFYNAKLADALFDYCVGAITGELRHAGECIRDKRIYFKPDGILQRKRGRHEAIHTALQLNPDSLLNTAIEVFGIDGWGSAYGGTSWYEISVVTAKISQLTRLRWIDEIIHCRHCGGKLFDRHIIFNHEDENTYRGRALRQFLDYRQNGHFDEDLEEAKYNLDMLLNEYANTIEKVLNYKPVPFGFITLSVIVHNKYGKSKGLNSTPAKTQKEVGLKLFKIVKCNIPGLETVKVYVSDKYGVPLKDTLYEIFTLLESWSFQPGKTAKVYILHSYLSKGKQYIRKCVVSGKGCFPAYKILHKIQSQILKNTNNPKSIKIYIDLI